jgi:hypothetical protein
MMHRIRASRVVRGGGEKMRKMLVAVLVTCMFALVSALSAPGVRAADDEPELLVCTFEADVVWEPTPYWTGTVTGDISGSIILMENPATFPGTTEHFDESCTITTTDGVVIQGYDLGVYNLKTFKFRANGGITDVSSPAWEYLVGYNLHFSGTTTPLIIGGDVHATGTIMLMAP